MIFIIFFIHVFWFEIRLYHIPNFRNPPCSR
nr:MAG TPA: hypothetical protein [Caudoviricetes sp.]